jgi:type IV pilus assembly protein PilC
MASFIYNARDPNGQSQTGLIEAANTGLALSQLRDRGWLVVSLNEELEEEDQSSGRSKMGIQGFLGPRNVQVELSLRQLAVMLRGGISLLAAMQKICEQSDSRAIRIVYSDLIDEVQRGLSFSEALESQPGFPAFVTRLVGVGERTGIQEDVLVQGADMMKSRREMVMDVVSALAYPFLIVVFISMAALYIVTTLIPKLTALLAGLGKELPPITASLVTASNYLQEWGPTILSAVGLFTVGFVVAWFTPQSRLLIDAFALRIPLLGKIFRLTGTLTFSQTMGTLLGSGVTVLDSLVTTQQMHTNTYLISIVQRSRDAIIRGNSLADSLRENWGYMPLLSTMVAVGEESGTLDEVLEEVSEFHKARLERLMKLFSAIITTGVIVCAGLLVAYVYIAFFVGMFAIAGK